MLILYLFMLQEVNLLNPGPLHAVVLVGESKYEEKTLNVVDLKVKGPDPYHLTLELKDHTEFMPLFRIIKIKKHPRQSFWFYITLDSLEVLEARIQPVTFSATEVDGDGSEIHIRLRELQSMVISGESMMKSCPNCEYEVNTIYWFCPRCGADLQLGTLEENEQQEPRQMPLIRYRVQSHEQ